MFKVRDTFRQIREAVHMAMTCHYKDQMSAIKKGEVFMTLRDGKLVRFKTSATLTTSWFGTPRSWSHVSSRTMQRLAYTAVSALQLALGIPGGTRWHPQPLRRLNARCSLS